MAILNKNSTIFGNNILYNNSDIVEYNFNNIYINQIHIVALIGMIVWFPKTKDGNWLICNGQEIMQSEYPELYNKILNEINGDTSHPLYTSTPNAVKIPNIQNVWIKSINDTTRKAGSLQNQKIYDHTHTFSIDTTSTEHSHTQQSGTFSHNHNMLVDTMSHTHSVSDYSHSHNYCYPGAEASLLWWQNNTHKTVRGHNASGFYTLYSSHNHTVGYTDAHHQHCICTNTFLHVHETNSINNAHNHNNCVTYDTLSTLQHSVNSIILIPHIKAK